MDTTQTPSGQPLTRHQRRELERQQRKLGQQNTTRVRTWKRVGLWVGLVVVIGAATAGLFVMAGNSGSSGGPVASVDRVADGDWVSGNRESKTVLVEFSDLQCPACKAFFPAVKKLAKNHPDDLAIVYRHFPLKQIHRNAQRAAQFAEAAGLQSKFWEFHDKLFDEQSDWSSAGDPSSKFRDYASALGLDSAKLATDANTQAAKDAVAADVKSGNAAAVNATPTFFLNGQRVSGFKSTDDFVKRVEEAINAAKG